MIFKGCSMLIIIGSFILSIEAISELDLFKRFPNVDLLNALTRSKSLLQINPSSTTDQCFEDYMNILNNASEKYENSYKLCLDTAQGQRAIAEEATLEDRRQLADKAQSSCDLISQCKEVDTATGEFECYVNAGSQNIQSMRSISSDATIQLSDLKEQYRLIANKENKCTREAKRTFDNELDDAYEDLNECIQASLPVIPSRAPMY